MAKGENVEVIFGNWIRSNADGWSVSGNIPEGKRPDKFIIFDRTGGDRSGMVLDRAEMLAEVYHKESRLEASQMANKLADNVQQMLSNGDITHVDVNSLVHLDDSKNGYYRYQLYINVYHRR